MLKGNNMSDLGMYFEAQAKQDSAYNLYNYAGCNLENAKIKCRLAEIKSQHEPLVKLAEACKTVECSGDYDHNRNLLYAAAFYVVIGRMPDGLNVPKANPPEGLKG